MGALGRGGARLSLCMTEWVFGYGSLVDAAALAPWLGRDPFAPGEVARCRLRGHRRTWNVARDNAAGRADKPHYVDPGTGERPALFVVAVNIRPAPGAAVNGLAFQVMRAQRDRIDRREFNYDRINAAELVDPPLEGPVWTYRGSQAAHARYRAGVAAGRAVVSRRYHRIVEGAFASLGEAALAEYRASTDPPAVPFADLHRTDWPPIPTAGGKG